MTNTRTQSRRAFRVAAVGLLVAALVGLGLHVGRAGASVAATDEARPSASDRRGESSQDAERAARLRELRARVGEALQNASLAARAARWGEPAASAPTAESPAPPPEANRTLTIELHALPPDEAAKMKAQAEQTLAGKRPPAVAHDAAEMKTMLEGIRVERDPQARFARLESYMQAATEMSENGQLVAFGDLVEMLGVAQADAHEDVP